MFEAANVYHFINSQYKRQKIFLVKFFKNSKSTLKMLIFEARNKIDPIIISFITDYIPTLYYLKTNVYDRNATRSFSANEKEIVGF